MIVLAFDPKRPRATTNPPPKGAGKDARARLPVLLVKFGRLQVGNPGAAALIEQLIDDALEELDE